MLEHFGSAYTFTDKSLWWPYMHLSKLYWKEQEPFFPMNKAHIYMFLQNTNNSMLHKLCHSTQSYWQNYFIRSNLWIIWQMMLCLVRTLPQNLWSDAIIPLSSTISWLQTLSALPQKPNDINKHKHSLWRKAEALVFNSLFTFVKFIRVAQHRG